MAKRLASYFHCSTEFTLAVLGGKWKTVILCYLKERPCRFSELRALLPGLSEKMLAERLRDLVAAGLVAQRKTTGKGGSSVYTLTANGRSLSKPLTALYDWGLEHAHHYNVEIGEPLNAFTAKR